VGKGHTRFLIKIISVIGAVVTLLAFARVSVAEVVIFSTKKSDKFGTPPVNVDKGDLAAYNTQNDRVEIIINGSNNYNIDAAHFLGNGHAVISIAGDAQVLGTVFDKGSLIDYDFFGQTASLYFNPDYFAGLANIDALYLRPDGKIVLSTKSKETIGAGDGALKCHQGDLVLYDPAEDSAQLYLDHKLIDKKANINAVHVLENGNILFSTEKKASVNGVSFGKDDIAEYNPATGEIVSIYFSGGGQDLDAFSLDHFGGAVPIPSTAFLLLGGVAALAFRRRR